MSFLKENISSILSIIVIVLCFLILLIGIRLEICDQNKEIIMLILGGILTTLTTIVGYYFGSSKGSSEKNITIQKTLDNKFNNNK